MTTIHCLLKECRSCLNDRCTRRTVQVVGTQCLDFTRRRSQFRNVTTTIRCNNQLCTSNRNGICGIDELTMKASGCVIGVINDGGKTDGRKIEGDRQIPIRY